MSIDIEQRIVTMLLQMHYIDYTCFMCIFVKQSWLISLVIWCKSCLESKSSKIWIPEC